mmetsp:Transcript_10310/g.31776  ORF Transcript_10310/g.31776 Transcript_10310/m.31776 type:complete len:423 (+) Transcript_10310:328-1596(+)
MSAMAARAPAARKKAPAKRPAARAPGGGRASSSSKDAPEHKRLAAQLKALEQQNKKATPQYGKLKLEHASALHRRLKEVGCDLTDAELRGLNKPDAEGEVPLHKVVYEYFALAQGVRGPTTQQRMDACVARCRALCEAGARVDHRNKYGDTPLLAAAQTDAADVARVLLDYGADLGAKNRQGYAPLLTAASENRPAAVAVLVPEMFAQRRSLDALSGGYAALHWACINDAPKAVACLLKHKADRNLGTKPDGHTPLMKAAAYNSAACVEQLLRARCDATAVDADGRTALHHAAKNKATYFPAGRTIFPPSGPSFSSRWERGRPRTSEQGRSPRRLCVQMLVASGVPADAADHHGQKAVFYAAVARSKPCVAAIAAATPNFKSTPDAAKVKLLLEGRRVQHDDDDDVGDGWGGCFGASGPGCF